MPAVQQAEPQHDETRADQGPVRNASQVDSEGVGGLQGAVPNGDSHSSQVQDDGRREGSGGASDIVLPSSASSAELPANAVLACEDSRDRVPATHAPDDDGFFRPSRERLDALLRSRKDGPPARIRISIGDGNCLPRAIVDTGCTVYDTYESLKAAALGYLESHQDETLAALHSKDHSCISLANLFSHLRNDGNYGDMDAVSFYALFLRREIRLWSVMSENMWLISNHSDYAALTSPEPIELAYTPDRIPIYDQNLQVVGFTSGHYDAIVPSSCCDPGNSLLSVRDRH
jgi:hypothetical protein